jgi:hypothetical protein
VEPRLFCEQLEHASFVPHPDGGRITERELGQKAPVDRGAARRPSGTAQVIRAGELDRELVQPGAGDAERGSKPGSEYSLNQPSLFTQCPSDDPWADTHRCVLLRREARMAPQPGSPLATSISSGHQLPLDCAEGRDRRPNVIETWMGRDSAVRTQYLSLRTRSMKDDTS